MTSRELVLYRCAFVMPIAGFSVVTRFSESAAIRIKHPEGAARVFEGVTLIKAGLGNSRDRNYYPPETLQRAVREGRFNRLRAYVDHPDSVSEEIQPERTVRDWAGVYSNARYNPGRKAVEADLTVFRSHKWLADTVEDLQRMGHGDMIGLSINGRGKTEPARRRLEEAGGDEVDVNEVKDFLELRSTDIVTEAGAGGGFVAQMLESARRGAQETSMARSNVNRLALQALKDGDPNKAQQILEGASAPPKGKKLAAAAVEDLDEADATAVADQIKDEAHARLDADAADDGEDVEPDEDDEQVDVVASDEDEDDEDEDEEDDEDGGDDAREAGSASSNAFLTASQRLKAQHRRTQEAKRKIIGATGTTGTVNKKNTHFTKRDGHTTKKRVKTTKTMGFRTGLKPGANISVSEADRQAMHALTRENANLRERNRALSEALNTHRTADRAARLLEASEIPARLHRNYVPKMVGLTEAQMVAFIDEKLNEISVLTEAVGGSLLNAHEGVEGAGSTLRESWGGSHGGDLDSVFSGMPQRQR